MCEPTSRIIIVGAGAAGIAAATLLYEYGYRNLKILEAGDRIGGRIHTVEFGGGTVELGATYCHGEQENVVNELARPLGLLESSAAPAGIFIDSTGTTADKDVINWLFMKCLSLSDDREYNSSMTPEILDLDHICHLLGSREEAESYGQYVTEMFYASAKKKEGIQPEILDQFLDWFHRFENTRNGSDDWNEVSLKSLIGQEKQYKECLGDQLLVWKEGGYNKIFDILMAKGFDDLEAMPIEEKVLFGNRVSTIEWDSSGGAEVFVNDNRDSYRADCVIITVSLGVLKNNAHKMFLPQLPDYKLAAIEHLGFGTVNKIFLKFERDWWPKDHLHFNLLWTKADRDQFLKEECSNKKRRWMLDVCGFYAEKKVPGVLCGWVAGSSARQLDECSDEEVISGCKELLDRFLGSKFSILPIQSILRSEWFSNPNFCGSYSYRSLDSDIHNVYANDLERTIFDDEGRPLLLFAGEATHSSYYSTVHGAIESGRKAANIAMSYIGVLGKRKVAPRRNAFLSACRTDKAVAARRDEVNRISSDIDRVVTTPGGGVFHEWSERAGLLDSDDSHNRYFAPAAFGHMVKPNESEEIGTPPATPDNDEYNSEESDNRVMKIARKFKKDCRTWLWKSGPLAKERRRLAENSVQSNPDLVNSKNSNANNH